MNKKALFIAVAVFLLICAGESLIKTWEALKEKEKRETLLHPEE